MKQLIILLVVWGSLISSSYALYGEEKIECRGKNDIVTRFSCLEKGWLLKSVVKGDQPGWFHMFFQDENNRVVIVPIAKTDKNWTIYKTLIRKAE